VLRGLGFHVVGPLAEAPFAVWWLPATGQGRGFPSFLRRDLIPLLGWLYGRFGATTTAGSMTVRR
jgi:hypothetical protein